MKFTPKIIGNLEPKTTQFRIWITSKAKNNSKETKPKGAITTLKNVSRTTRISNLKRTENELTRRQQRHQIAHGHQEHKRICGHAIGTCHRNHQRTSILTHRVSEQAKPLTCRNLGAVHQSWPKRKSKKQDCQ